MIKKNIYVVGGGFYGCLTAIKLKYKDPNVNITIIDNNNKLLTSFNSLKINNLDFNNGFHGIELPRAQGLFNFLRNKLNIKLNIKSNNRYLYIKGNLIKYEDKIQNWPINLKNNFRIKKKFSTKKISEFKKIISLNYYNFLKNIGKRYSDNFIDVIHLLIPWFLPSNLKLIESDEGSVFRNKVREKKINSKYGFPDKIAFSSLQKPIQKEMSKIGIKLMLNTNFIINGDNIFLINKKNNKEKKINKDDIIFFCGSSASILKQINKKLFLSLIENDKLMINIICKIDNLPKKFHNISEILCADEKFSSISRISFVKNEKKLNYFIQVECFINSEIEISYIKNNITEYLDKLIYNNLVNKKIKLIDIKVSRKVFFPKITTINKSHKYVQKWIEKSKLNIKNNIYFSPINMSKAWIWSKHNTINIKKK